MSLVEHMVETHLLTHPCSTNILATISATMKERGLPSLCTLSLASLIDNLQDPLMKSVTLGKDRLAIELDNMLGCMSAATEDTDVSTWCCVTHRCGPNATYLNIHIVYVCVRL